MLKSHNQIPEDAQYKLFPQPPRRNDLDVNELGPKPAMNTDPKPLPPVWTRDRVLKRLEYDDGFVECALRLLHEQQTWQEQQQDKALIRDGVGFNKVDARLFGRFAKRLAVNRRLSESDLATCRRIQTSGRGRLAKYAGQLVRILNGVGNRNDQLVSPASVLERPLEPRS
jgi:hypothetical protein